LARIIAITNQKGGVGKTTTSINLSASLAAADCRVLVVDCDPQANSTAGLGFPHNPSRLGVYEVLVDRIPLESAVIKTEFDGLDLLPAGRHLAGANVELAAEEDRLDRLTFAFEAIRERYDFVFIDCPPALDLLTLNALVAADSVLIPIQCEYFALEGISALMETVDQLRDGLNPRLEVEGVLLTMFDERTTLTKQVATDLRDFFGATVFQTVIPRNIRLAEAPSHGKPVLQYDLRSKGAESYLDLAREFLDRLDAKSRGQAAQ
jgi:chromosome partitioning protein